MEQVVLLLSSYINLIRLTSRIDVLVAQHVDVDGGLPEQLNWNTKRAMGRQCILHFIFCTDNADTEAFPLDKKVREWLSCPDPPDEEFCKDLDATLTSFWNIASDPQLNQAFTKIDQKVSPVEFVFICKSFCLSLIFQFSHVFALNRCSSLLYARKVSTDSREGNPQPTAERSPRVQGPAYEHDHWQGYVGLRKRSTG